MNIATTGETGARPEPESQLPDCMTLWRCIGCGAMGNSEPCAGKCDYRKLQVVSAEQYADLLEQFSTIADRTEILTALVNEIAALGEGERDHERAYRRLQSRVRKILRTAQSGEAAAAVAITPDDEFSTVWLCATCGQVEAPQPCLGVCIRRNGEFLRAGAHVELAFRAEAERQRAAELGALARQMACVAPHAGQWENACRAFREKAIRLLAQPPAPKGR